MYEFIAGTLVERRPDRVVLDAGGVGYRILVPLSTYEQIPAKPRKPVRLLVHHHQREDRQALYGFATAGEREFFETILAVSGVGPALALSILSSMPFEEFRSAVAAGDPKPLTRIKGVGKKLAGRLLVELTEAMQARGPVAGGSPSAATPPANASDAALALVSLGYDRHEAESLAAKAAADLGADASPGDVVRHALRTRR